MNDRLLTLLGALAALAFAVGLMLSRTPPNTGGRSRPTSTDTGSQGLAATSDWLQASGYATVALRQRFDALESLSGPRQGNLLLISAPGRYPARPLELHALQAWVRRGNDVLLLAALNSRPPWSAGPATALGPLLAALDLSLYGPPKHPDLVCGPDARLPDEKHPADARPQAPRLLKPSPEDIDAPAVAGVREVRIQADADALTPGYGGQIGYEKNRLRDSVTEQWLCDPARAQAALWQFRLGRGRIWVSAYPQLFSNANLGLASNARLLSNIIAISVRNQGAVIFDDMHQGDTTLYDPRAFFADPRLHASLWLLLAIWLLYLLGYNSRFAPPAPPASGITPARFVEDLGGFVARHLSPAQTGQALLEQLHTALRRRQGRATASLWDALAHEPALDPALARLLREQHQALQDRPGAIRLRRLATTLHQIRKQLQ